MDKQVGIIGAGISGLLACKHLLEKGFEPTVFEARGEIGGVWSFCTLGSTKLQTPKSHYQFSDFPWPPYVKENFPHHTQVKDYLNAYALHFHVLPCIKFNTKVVGIDYTNENEDGNEIENANEDGNCKKGLLWDEHEETFPQQNGGKWNIFAQDSCHPCSSTKVYQVDFVILCIGKYSNLPYFPDFPFNQGPEIFEGRILHSLDYAALDDHQASELIRNKRITVVGFQKSAVDVISEIARKNGVRHPSTLLYKRVHWTVSEGFLTFSFKLLNRFAELMIHKPNEGFFLGLLASLLSPLLWIYSKSVETYLKWIYPLKKYNMVPTHSFLNQIASCMVTVLPSDLYDMVRQGCIILRRSQTLGFYKDGVIADGTEIPSDLVVFATGYRSEEHLKSIFTSSAFQRLVTGSSAPLYRECIHPRIPQLAILGYLDSPSIMFSTEMRSKWLANLLAGSFKLPSTREMVEDTLKWKNCMVRYTGGQWYRRSCVSVLLQIYSNDQLCKDMACDPRRKSWFLPELFAAYGPIDYADVG